MDTLNRQAGECVGSVCVCCNRPFNYHFRFRWGGGGGGGGGTERVVMLGFWQAQKENIFFWAG